MLAGFLAIESVTREMARQHGPDGGFRADISLGYRRTVCLVFHRQVAAKQRPDYRVGCARCFKRSGKLAGPGVD